MMYIQASFKEILGSYDPNTATGSTILRLDTERVKYWVTRGAVPSYAMRRLMITAGMLPPYVITKCQKLISF